MVSLQQTGIDEQPFLSGNGYMAIRENTGDCISQALYAMCRISARLLLPPLALGARRGNFAVFLRLHYGRGLSVART